LSLAPVVARELFTPVDPNDDLGGEDVDDLGVVVPNAVLLITANGA